MRTHLVGAAGLAVALIMVVGAVAMPANGPGIVIAKVGSMILYMQHRYLCADIQAHQMAMVYLSIGIEAFGMTLQLKGKPRCCLDTSAVANRYGAFTLIIL
jgi:hypothetical protein